MKQIALVADIHLHDLHGGYGFKAADGSGLALRSFEDTRQSTRVFNESEAALLAILDDIAARGIYHVALLGDQTDDGQPGAYDALDRILTHYETAHDMRFYATLGNHDAFGPEGKDQSKWLTGASGKNPIRVTSDPNAPLPAFHSSAMRGLSTREAVEKMSRWGFMKPDHALYWETPFGSSTSLENRIVPNSTKTLIDASYLIEPIDGLWLLMIDANAFSKADKSWKLHADAAWDHLLVHRRYLIDWIATIVERAEKAGKALITCSHYPMVPFPLAGSPSSPAPIGSDVWLKRLPSFNAANELVAAGLKIHFSGHMHSYNTTTIGTLTNVAVPSPVAFPGGYLLVEASTNELVVEHITLRETPGFDVAFPGYRQQAGSCKLTESCLNAKDYATFLRLLGPEKP